jgi:hypothetical protein
MFKWDSSPGVLSSPYWDEPPSWPPSAKFRWRRTSFYLARANHLRTRNCVCTKMHYIAINCFKLLYNCKQSFELVLYLLTLFHGCEAQQSHHSRPALMPGYILTASCNLMKCSYKLRPPQLSSLVYEPINYRL